jgi:AcrR family transcriptional regulator
MGRRALYSTDQILDAARDLAAQSGPAAVTIAALGSALGGAPSGSLYHRFASRNELLGRLWLRTAAGFQDGFAAAASSAPDDAHAAGLRAALSMPARVRVDPQGARIMLLHRREDFLSSEWPAEMQAEARRLKQHLDDTVRALSRRLLGDSPEALRATAFATIDIPFGAVRRHVMAGEAPPASLDPLIEAAYRAVIAAFAAPPTSSRRT